ncbi:serine/threonine-protein kinase RsbW [Rhodococcus sp. OK519]|uniref:ATP-binding protein n=1 Tax=Rhodococcus sp. OK519 TaxID=2135729 RepID=UPI000D33B411|nr:serine/threonine-protein kinase RsbW [Rhodococcus sp. OK519]
MVAVPAQVSVLSAARAALTEFATEAELPDAMVPDMLLATYEAMANIVEHAYPHDGAGTFDLKAAYNRADETLTITIADHGSWKSGGPDPASRRGRGLQLMRSCSDVADVVPDDSGTQVHLQWRGRPGSAVPDENSVVGS